MKTNLKSFNAHKHRIVFLIPMLITIILILSSCYVEPDRIVDDTSGIIIGAGEIEADDTFTVVVTPTPMPITTESTNQVDWADWNFSDDSNTIQQEQTTDSTLFASFFNKDNPVFILVVALLGLTVALLGVRAASLRIKAEKIRTRNRQDDNSNGGISNMDGNKITESINVKAETAPQISVNPNISVINEYPEGKNTKKRSEKSPSDDYSRNMPVKLRERYRSLYAEDEELKSEEIIISTQDNGNVEGVIKVDGEDKYTFRGTFQNQILTGEYYSKDPHDSERGSINLKVVTGTMLSGFCSFSKYTLDPSRDPIRVSPYIWVSSEEKEVDLLNGTFDFCSECSIRINEGTTKATCCASKLVDMPILLESEAKRMQDSYFRANKKTVKQKDFSEPVRIPISHAKTAYNDVDYTTTTEISTAVRQVCRQQKKRRGRKPIDTTSADSFSECPCYFYDENRLTCTIYSERPIDCRLFPYDIVVDNNEYWLIYYDEICPRPLPDIHEMKRYAHVLRPYLFIYWSYLHITTCKNTAPRLSEQHYEKLFKIKSFVF